MDLFEVIQKRQSVRAYQPRALEPGKLDAILAAVQQAPSAGNLQGYQVWVVRAEAVKKRLARAALGQDFLAQAPVVLVFCAQADRSGKYGKRGAELYCLQDATIAVAYAQLAATALGVATCWIGAFDEAEAARGLELPTGLRPIAMLPIGYAAETPARTPRRALTDLVVQPV